MEIRGAVATAGPLAFATGVLAAVTFGYKGCFGNAELWPVLLALTGIVGTIHALILIFFVPESPKYLLLTKNDKSGGREALRKLRNGSEEDIDKEVEMITASQISVGEGNVCDIP